MKRLLLLRHAKAVPATGASADIARPLAERGERDARRIGERLRERRLHAALILTSPATRALATAHIVASAIDYPRESIRLDGRLYLAEPATILDIVAAQDAALETLLVVGHNPGLTEAAHRLLPDLDVDDLPTGAIVGIDYAGAVSWARMDAARGAFSYYDFPKSSGAPITGR
jgi:phosphohistidine phosphatase